MKNAFISSATCNPIVDSENTCFVLQTTFIIGVEGAVDTDVAAYEGYKAIKENMDNGNYTETVPAVASVEFVSPLPLIEPPGISDGDPSPDSVDNSEFQRDVDVNPWTIGFSVASVMGGFVSLVVYARARRSRERGSLLEDTTPWVNPESENVI